MNKLIKLLLNLVGPANIRKSKGKKGINVYISPDIFTEAVLQNIEDATPGDKATVSHFEPSKLGQAHLVYIGKPRTSDEVAADFEDLF